MTTSTSPHGALPEDTFTLEGGGHVSVALPKALSKAEYDELSDWLELMRRKAERKVVDESDEKVRASGSSDSGAPEISPDQDDDSLSWE